MVRATVEPIVNNTKHLSTPSVARLSENALRPCQHSRKECNEGYRRYSTAMFISSRLVTAVPEESAREKGTNKEITANERRE